MNVYDELKDLYREISSIHRTLYNLESSGNINTSLFKKKIEVLKLKLREEDKLLKELVQSVDYNEIRKEIFSYQGSDDFYSRIRDFLVSYEGTNIEIFDEDEEDLVQFKLTSMSVYKIFLVSVKNIFRVYVFFLQLTIDKLLHKEIKDRLLRLKYYNCIVKHDIENAMLDLNFCVSDEVYTDLNMIIDLMQVDDSLSEKVVLESYITTINDTVEKLMTTDDKEYSSDDCMRAIDLHLQCMLKACFAIMNEHEYQIIIDGIVEKMKELINEENVGSLENIVDIINNRNEYRSKIRKLSMKPLRYD